MHVKRLEQAQTYVLISVAGKVDTMAIGAACIGDQPFFATSRRARLMSAICDVVDRNPAVLGGTAVFASTRVPVQTLLDYLAAGQSLAEFLDDFPSVEHAQAVAVLEGLKQALLTGPHESAA